MQGNGIMILGAILLSLESELALNYGLGWETAVPQRKKNSSEQPVCLYNANRIDERWQGLRNALAGLFCASLGSMDEQRTTSPTLSFAPEGLLPDWTQPHHLRHATLPSEHVCTENLTPFLKLLPCKSLSGIASLLNPHKLFDADWHGMGLHVIWHPDSGVEARLTFQAVSDPLRYSSGQTRGLYL